MNYTNKVKVGDIVEITKGHICWNTDMDRLIGRTFEVINIIPKYRSKLGENWDKIVLDGGYEWNWYQEAGHFKILTSTNSQSSNELNYELY